MFKKGGIITRKKGEVITIIAIISTIMILIMLTTNTRAETNTKITGRASASITGKAISGFSSFIDFVKSKISGKSTTQNMNINITVLALNTPPRIVYVMTVPDQTINEGGEKIISLNFIVHDDDGYQTITSANATINNGTGMTRQNNTCQKTNSIGLTEQNYTCTVGIWYYDNAGIWNITIGAGDQTEKTAINGTTTLQILLKLKIHPRLKLSLNLTRQCFDNNVNPWEIISGSNTLIPFAELPRCAASILPHCLKSKTGYFRRQSREIGKIKKTE